MRFIRRYYRTTTLLILGLLLTYLAYLQDSIWFREIKNNAVCNVSSVLEKVSNSIIG